MKNLLVVTAALEFGTGLVLLMLPSTAAKLLLGQYLDAAIGLTVARVAGVALLALGAACWFARLDTETRAARGLASAMMLYNTGIVVVFGYAALASGLSSIGLWPVMLVHSLMAGWCFECTFGRRSPGFHSKKS